MSAVKLGGIGHAQFIMDNSGIISDFYDLGKSTLGEGSYGVVCKATRKGCQEERAVKTMGKQQMTDVEGFKREIAIMKRMDHPHIIRLFESFEDKKNIYLVMELCDGGELFDRILEAGSFTERVCAGLVQQMLKVLFYMHENRVAHRDLKPENFLFSHRGPIEENCLKLIDFGLARPFEVGVPMATKAGSPFYVAPEVIAGSYDQLCDIWSLGGIVFVMLCGYPPFYAETDEEIYASVKKGEVTFDPDDWSNISQDVKDLILAMLTLDPAKRITAEQALQHTWVEHTAPQAANVCLKESFICKLRDFCGMNRLKKAALHIIAAHLSDREAKALRETFMELDKNGDGLLSVEEMKAGMAKADLKNVPADLQRILEDVDSDGSGAIDYTEFLAATLDKRAYLKEDAVWSAFRLFDRDGDGKITPEEMKAVLSDDGVQSVVGEHTVAQLLTEVDRNGDGVIDFNEFMAMMRGGSA